jgi:hypothetical protein
MEVVMNTLIIVVDLGHFKVYRVSKDSFESPRIELLKSYDTIEAHGKLSEKLSDGAGRFGLLGGKTGVKGYGEAHNIKLEAKKKLIKNIADDINTLIKKKKCNEWYLAAGKSLNNQILGNLDPSVRAKIKMNIISDLTKKHKTALLSCFKIE